MKDTVQELVVPNALYVMTTSILERIINTCILILKLKPVTSDIFLTVNQILGFYFNANHFIISLTDGCRSKLQSFCFHGNEGVTFM